MDTMCPGRGQGLHPERQNLVASQTSPNKQGHNYWNDSIPVRIGVQQIENDKRFPECGRERAGISVPNGRYELLERSWSVRNTVPTPNPRRFAIRLIETPCRRNSTTCSLLKIFLGRCGGRFRPDRL